jgi:hypothetical protein
MATLIDWSEVQSKLELYQRLYDCETRSIALLYVVMEYELGLTPEEIRDCITDGGQDRGIDAVFIDDREGRNIVHLLQSKTTDSFDKASHNFPGSEIDKILSFVNDVLSKDISLKLSCNSLLWEKVQEIWSAFDKGTPSFVVHLCSNMNGLITAELTRMKNTLSMYRTFEVREHTLNSIASLIIEQRKPQITRQIRLVDKQYFERVDGNIRGLIGTIDALELVKLIQDPDHPEQVFDSIFDDNVRVYLTSKNRINRAIIQSALSDTSAEFWYLNNGITMTCDSIDYPPGARAPVVTMENIQIVNGGQTSNALFEAYVSDPDKVKDVLVLIRIYETKQREISQKIAESTNSQTPIRSRDLRANDEVQRKIEEVLLDIGYYYERKSGQHEDQDPSKRVDAVSAGRAYAAYYLGLPDVAYKGKERIVGDLYDSIFGQSTDIRKLLTPYQVFVSIDTLKKPLQLAIRKGEQVDSRDMVLIHGAYHILYAVACLCGLRSLDESDTTVALSQIPDAIEVVRETVEKEMNSDSGFSFNLFFKEAKTKMKIEQVALMKTANGH